MAETAVTPVQTSVQAVERRNIVFNIVEGAVYISSTAFVNPQTVVPALVARMGGSNVEIGMLSVLSYVGVYIPQVFAARYVETLPWKKPWSVFFGTGQRVIVLLMGLLILIFGNWQSGNVLWGFLFLFFLNSFMAGVTTPGWFDLFAKITATKKRGRLVGFRNSLGGLGAFLGGFVLTWLLATFMFPVSYAIGFFIAFLLQFSSIIIQRKLIESEPSPVVAPRPFMSFLRELHGVIRANPEFKRFLTASAFLVIAMVPSGFFTVYVLKDFQADESIVGQYTLAMVAIQVVSALVIGFITDRYGNKLAFICTSVSMLLASVWAILAPSPGWFTLVYIFFGITLGAEVMVRYNMAIEYCPPQLRPTFVGLMNTLLAPCYLAGLAGGVISDLVGYKGVFILGILASLIGGYILITKVRDPRHMTA
ncbi:MAG: MFS transporter [Bacteroidetes bacterium]|nr:MFS transporter [Bacteroidota bacterium]